MLKKIIKQNFQIKHKKHFNSELFWDKDFDNEIMQSFFEKLDLYLQASKIFFKNSPGDTSTVAVVELDQKFFVIKRYNIKNFWHGLKIQFRKSHGLRSFCYSYLLSSLGIDSVKPVAVVQKKIGFIKLQSYFVSCYEKGEPGCVYFHNESDKQMHWHETMEYIFAIIKKMQTHSIYHGDFHFGNFVIVNKKPILLDLDHVKIVKNKRRFKKLHLKDLNNFNRYLKRNSKVAAMFKEEISPFAKGDEGGFIILGNPS